MPDRTERLRALAGGSAAGFLLGACLGACLAAALGQARANAASTPPVRPAKRYTLAAMLAGPSAQVDPGFPYYADRSAESIASEIVANGYRSVHYVVTTDSEIRADLVRAFHNEGLPVWYLTFSNVAYNTKDFPPGWEAWRMKLRASKGEDFVRLCMNDPGYIAFKRRAIADAMRKYPFDGVELVEPFWPDMPGPQSATYGCLCDDCRAAFRRDNPGEAGIPEFTDTASPLYYEQQPDLYRKWMDFRVKSISRFLNAALSDARRQRPGVPALVWTLAQDTPNAVAGLREGQGMDAAEMAAAVRPDALCFQTNWQDWSKPVLPPDYLGAYRPLLDHLRAAHPNLPVVLQVDTGSLVDSRRTMGWLRDAEKVARGMGARGTVNYEYFITKSMYDDPPRLAFVRPRANGLTLVFQKRIADKAAVPANFRVTNARGGALSVTGVKVDGNMVRLGVRGLAPGRRYTVRVAEVTDTPERWLFKGLPAHTVRGVSAGFTGK